MDNAIPPRNQNLHRDTQPAYCFRRAGYEVRERRHILSTLLALSHLLSVTVVPLPAPTSHGGQGRLHVPKTSQDDSTTPAGDSPHDQHRRQNTTREPIDPAVGRTAHHAAGLPPRQLSVLDALLDYQTPYAHGRASGFRPLQGSSVAAMV
jgi:hypothetical protein